MRSRVVLVGAVAAAAALVLSIDLTAQRVVIPGPVAQEAEQRGRVRVIVGLDTGFVAEGLLSAPAIEAQHQAIDRAQDAVLSRVAADNVTRFEAIPFMAVTVDSAGLAALANDPLVASLSEDQYSRASLVDSGVIQGAAPLWASGYTGAGWQVAILDTGVERSHSLFGNRVVSEACYSNTALRTGLTSLCPGGATSSTAVGSAAPCTVNAGCDHGTHVAGIAAGSGLRTGMAPGASIIAIQVFTGTTCNNAPCTLSYDEDLLLGLERVRTLAGPNNANRIAAVNYSVSGSLYSGLCDASAPALLAAIDNLRSIGIATVVSSGNDGSTFQIGRPSCLSNVVSVGSATKTNAISTFSNRNNLLALLAIGDGVESAGVNNSFTVKSGTSMAAPMVTGMFALAKQLFPLLTPSPIIRAFRDTGLPIISGGPVPMPFPRIRIDVAFQLLLRTNPPAAPGTPTVAVNGNNVTINWTPSPWGGVTNYFVQGGTAPGSQAVTQNVGLATTLTTALPNGRYYVRIGAVNPASIVRSPEVSFVVGDLTPDPPTGLQASRTPSTITLSWTAPASGSAPRSYRINVGSLSGRSNIGVVTVGPQTSVTYPLPGPGFYFVRVHSVNDAGVSAASNEIIIIVDPPEPPGPPGNLRYSLSSRAVQLDWDPSVSVTVPISYILQVGSAPGTTNLLETAPQTGTSFYVPAAPPGSYYVRVRAVTSAGRSNASNEVRIDVR